MRICKFFRICTNFVQQIKGTLKLIVLFFYDCHYFDMDYQASESREFVSVLKQAGIDPKSVVSVAEQAISHCTWCEEQCGHSIILRPCCHTLCGNCCDSLVDQSEETSTIECPHCKTEINDFQWVV